MKLHYYPIAILLNMLVTVHCYANDPFAELDQEVKQLSSDDSAEFEHWYIQQMQDFNQWQQGYLADWDKKQQTSIKKWGDTQIASANVIVSYDNQHDARTVIDLDKNEVTVTYLPKENAESGTSENKEKIINKVIKNNKQLWTDIGLAKPIEADSKSILVQNLAIDTKAFDEVKQEIVAQTERQMSQLDIFASEQPSTMLEQKQQKIISNQKSLMRGNEQKRLLTVKSTLEQQKKAFKVKPQKAVTYKVKLPKSSFSARIQKYLPTVNKESSKQHLSPELILAIVHTESHFNPRAKSSVPAYGLMQIVPTSAGYDVNKLYRGKDTPMKVSELYNPNVNIETGTAYLKILQSRYLKGIKNSQSATYSIIAAYNTGAGNVAKAFGERRVSKAIKKINAMTSEQVYKQLIKNLPYAETRNYLKKVNDRMKSYQHNRI